MLAKGVKLLGRSYDLKSAYRQMSLALCIQWCAYIITWDIGPATSSGG